MNSREELKNSNVSASYVASIVKKVRYEKLIFDDWDGENLRQKLNSK